MTAPAIVRPPVVQTWTDPAGRFNYRFTLPGPARTKKTSNNAMRTGKHCPVCKLGTGHLRVLPSERFVKWQSIVKSYVYEHGQLILALASPVQLAALVYRDKNLGDLGGYLNAICDVLQECSIILNDRQVESFDGSRLLKDADNPRVEIVLTVLGPPVAVQEGLEL